MQILNYDKNEIFKLDIPKIIKSNKPKKTNENNCYIVIASILLIGLLFNINRGLKN